MDLAGGGRDQGARRRCRDLRLLDLARRSGSGVQQVAEDSRPVEVLGLESIKEIGRLYMVATIKSIKFWCNDGEIT